MKYIIMDEIEQKNHQKKYIYVLNYRIKKYIKSFLYKGYCSI